MSNLASVGGTITNIAGLAFTVAALGITLEFVDRAIDRAVPSGRKGKRKPIFDTGYGMKRNGGGSILDPYQSKGKKQSTYNNFFGGY